MNIIELIGNKFLLSLFPKGVEENVLIGQVSLDLADRIMLGIHITQPPANTVTKWGVWGKDYNVIVINVLAQFISKADIINWPSVQPAPLILENKDDGTYAITSKGDDWSITIELKALTFQRCDVYCM
ncbi:hypothetical protein FEM41_16160 [Jejubacter calystegiae]|uniref:Uncharacterized protein n=1 Tax=Jejubacter calystegiae TaxID=2579935 RepID=A0A4P8YK18_9ENTR|nr:hypothetical protein [Jejubacter calystegiae]QCT21069.1 hypothetical protein FEM41_16160 [Jejubacter calystegiae]